MVWWACEEQEQILFYSSMTNSHIGSLVCFSEGEDPRQLDTICGACNGESSGNEAQTNFEDLGTKGKGIDICKRLHSLTSRMGREFVTSTIGNFQGCTHLRPCTACEDYKEARFYDLNGKTLIPGLIEPHLHPSSGINKLLIFGPKSLLL